MNKFRAYLTPEENETLRALMNQEDKNTPVPTLDTSDDIITETVTNTPIPPVTQDTSTKTAIPENTHVSHDKRFRSSLHKTFEQFKDSNVRFRSAMQIVEQYGVQEGLHQIRENDPEMAIIVERYLKQQEKK